MSCTGCAVVIDLNFTIFGQARQFIETCGKKSLLSNGIWLLFSQFGISAQAAKKQHLDCPKWISNKQAVPYEWPLTHPALKLRMRKSSSSSLVTVDQACQTQTAMRAAKSILLVKMLLAGRR